MNDTEKRRKKLLEQTRNLYQDDRMIPAVHPRYRMSYYQIYPENTEYHKGMFGIRCLICILIFGGYIMMGINNQAVLGIDDLQVKEMIMADQISGLY